MRYVLILMLAAGITLQLPAAAPAAARPFQSRTVPICAGECDGRLFLPPGKRPMPLRTGAELVRRS